MPVPPPLLASLNRLGAGSVSAGSHDRLPQSRHSREHHAAMRRDPERYATRIEEAAASATSCAASCAWSSWPNSAPPRRSSRRWTARASRSRSSLPALRFSLWITDNQGVEAARLVNDGVAAMVARNPRACAAMATLPMQHSEAAVAELERAARAARLQGGGLAATAPRGELADPVYRPLLRRAQEQDDPLHAPQHDRRERTPRLLLPHQPDRQPARDHDHGGQT